MSRRIEIELTSRRDDGTFTWRAAGARQPKGVVAGSLLPADAAVGSVLKVEADTGLDGTEIVAVVAERAPRKEAEHLELISTPVADDALVTSKLVGKGRGDRDGRRRGPRRDDGRERRGGERRERRGGEGRGRDDRRRTDDSTREGRTRPPRDRAERATPPRPKVPRLRPGRVHRNAALAELEPQQRPIAEQVLKGGIPAVRQGIERQNEQARAAGNPEIKPEGLIEIAEALLPRLRTAEWRDRADAALASIDEVDLRDLRSVVVASDDNARDDATRALAAELRTKLAERVERAQAEWLAELDEALTSKRVVRALKLSSRPPKAGSPLPAGLADRIAGAANAALTVDVGQTRWVAIIDALAYSPVRHKVMPEALPDPVGDELRDLIGRVATRLPELANRFGIEPTEPSKRPARPNRRSRGARSAPKTATGGAKASSAPSASTSDAAPAERPASQASAPEATTSAPTTTAAPEAAPSAPAPTEATSPTTPPASTTDDATASQEGSHP